MDESEIELKIVERRTLFRRLIAPQPAPRFTKLSEETVSSDDECLKKKPPVAVDETGNVSDDEDNDDDHADTNLALTRFWTDVSTTRNADFESAVERYFRHPHIAAIYAHLDTCEQSLRDDDVIASFNAFSDGFPPSGFVYAAWNPLFALLIKIGATMRTPQIRLRELSGAGVPEPFELVACIPSTNPFQLEREIHRHFDDVRKYGRKKEFFTLTREEVKTFFETLAACGKSMPERKRKAD